MQLFNANVTLAMVFHLRKLSVSPSVHAPQFKNPCSTVNPNLLSTLLSPRCFQFTIRNSAKPHSWIVNLVFIFFYN